MTIYPMLINGKAVDGADSLNIINPATGESFAKVARASSDNSMRPSPQPKRLSRAGRPVRCENGRRRYVASLTVSMRMRPASHARW
jgi:hypothetical protein